MRVSWATRFRFAIERHGWPAVLGLVMVLASLPVFWYASAAAQDFELLQGKLREQRARAQSQPLPANPDNASSALAEFIRLLPDSEASTKAVRLLHSSAAKHGIQLASGEYRLLRESDDGLQRYQITLPVSGTYPAIRAWLADGLNSLPTLAVDEVNFVRQTTVNPVVQAQVRWSLYLARPR